MSNLVKNAKQTLSNYKASWASNKKARTNVKTLADKTANRWLQESSDSVGGNMLSMSARYAGKKKEIVKKLMDKYKIKNKRYNPFD